MEFRYRSEEESKSWSEESEDGLWERDEGSGIRSYECVFCKRGFTTAQALGGHMNIHRKHRASSSSSASPNHNKSINNPNNNFPSNSSIHISNSSSTILLDATDDTTTTTTTNLDLPFYSPISTPPPHPYNNYHQFSINPSTAPLPPNPITSNQRGLSLYQTNIHKVADQYCSEEDGLDLELRLGYHP